MSHFSQRDSTVNSTKFVALTFSIIYFQTCIAPDYILCNKSQRDTLISKMVPLLKEWLGDRPQDSKDFGRIVNERHFERVMNLLNTTKGTVAHGERNRLTSYHSVKSNRQRLQKYRCISASDAA